MLRDLRDDVLKQATLASWPSDGGLKSRLDGHCIELRCTLVGLVVFIKSTGEITAKGKISHLPILSNKKNGPLSRAVIVSVFGFE
jgi:hypothetical protein